jgi:hypothetical protein
MKTFRAIEIILASTVATLMLASGAAAQQHFSRYEDRLADRSEALESAERAPAVSWYERRTGRGVESSEAAIAVPLLHFHERAPSCATTLALRPQRPWCG